MYFYFELFNLNIHLKTQRNAKTNLSTSRNINVLSITEIGTSQNYQLYTLVIHCK